MHATLGKASCTLGTNLGMRRLGKSSTAKGIPHKTVPLKGSSLICQAAASETDSNGSSSKVAGASTDLTVIYQRLGQLALPYWTDPKVGATARWNLAAVVGLTLATTGVSVLFNFLGRDFLNALSEKNEELFTFQLFKYLGAFVIGIPVFVFKSYYQSKLALEWRSWLTNQLMDDYFKNRTFYSLQAQATVDNPDQRISSDVAAFTGTALNLALVILNAGIDLVSFSGILYSIYPPLFGALIAYSVSGTVLSIALGKPLVGLNFAQEAREADLRYGLVRVRENAEAVAFYRGEEDEKALLQERLKAAVSNYLGLLVASRNLDFFTSFYRYLIQLLPAAVVAPLFFQGKIDFGVINQSQSAFNHVLNDLSLIVYQFESLAGFSAVIDRLGQFQEAMGPSNNPAQQGTTTTNNSQTASSNTAAPQASSSSENGQLDSNGSSWNGVVIQYQEPVTGNQAAASITGPMLQLSSLSVVTPDRRNLLVKDLDLSLAPGSSLLIMGPSGAGKTSILRTLAGLWMTGSGHVRVACSSAETMFLPQKPYMVLGSLRDQVLYPTYAVDADKAIAAMIHAEAGTTMTAKKTESATNSIDSTKQSANGSMPADSNHIKPPAPSDDEVIAVLRQAKLGHLLARYKAAGNGNALDAHVDWASALSLGEQQRVAWARLLLARPRLALLDEASSALDQTTEEELYQELSKSGITYISVAHRSTLKQFHSNMLQLKQAVSADVPLEKSATQNVGSDQPEPSMKWELMPLSASSKA